MKNSHLLSGRVRVSMTGAKETLSEELCSIVRACGDGQVKNTKDLLDLCGQWSEEEEEGKCDDVHPNIDDNLALSDDNQEDVVGYR